MDKAEQPTTQDDYQAIYLAPKCFDERVWCEHDAPVECQCDDGPHDWIKFHRTTSLTAQEGLVERLDDATLDEIILNFAGGVVQVPSEHNPRGYVSYYRPREAMRQALSAIKEQHHD